MSGDAPEIEATLSEAFEQGVNFFDTADCYSQGDSERVLGRVFRGKRDRIIICSKAGKTIGSLQRLRSRAVPFAKRIMRRWSASRNLAASLACQFHAQNFRPGYIEKAIALSLSRLKTDYLDLFLLHGPDVSALSDPGLFDRLDRLRQRGMIRYYGVSLEDSVTSQEIGLSLARPDIAALQIAVDPYHTSTISAVERQMRDNAVGLIGRAPFARGALFHDERGLAVLAQSAPARPAQVAIRLAMQLNPHGTVLVGMTNRQHLRENLQALELPPIGDHRLEALSALRNPGKSDG
jgi:aryl-alcohol dehydrogenase-like predicted oxidoreductase